MPSVHFLFRDARATPAVLEFLEDTRVGQMPSRVLLAGGPDVEEDGMEEVALWAPEAEEGPEISASEEMGGAGSPPLACFSFPLSFFCFLYTMETSGEKGKGMPYYDCAGWSRVREGVDDRKDRRCPTRGQRQSRCHGPSGPM